MKRLFPVVLLFLLAAAGCARPAPEKKEGYVPFRVEMGEYAVITPASRSFASWDDLMDAMLGADVIFVGEEHDHTVGHMMEAKILRDLSSAFPRLSLSLEMFERDVQPILDDYLAGKIDEKTFLKNSRPWPNYDPDYKRLIELAKARGLPVVAANIPRPLAMKVAMSGVDGLPPEMRKYVAAALYAPDDEYKRRFIEVMKAMGSAHGRRMPVKPAMFEAMYKAQCIKDDTMAESIVKQIRSHGGKVIHYNGCFHSDYGLGTAMRVKRLAPDLKVLVVKIARVPHKLEPPFEGLDPRIADFVIAMTE